MSLSPRLFVAPLLACSTMLASCGDDEPAATSSLSAHEVAWHVQVLASQAPVVRFYPTDNELILAHAAASREGIAPAYVPGTPDCYAGALATSEAARSSPFSMNELAVTRFDFQDCLLYGGPPADVLDNSILLQGIEERGAQTLSGGGQITYQQLGAPESEGWFERRLRGLNNGVRYEDFTRQSGRLDFYQRVAGSQRELEALIHLTHEFDIALVASERFTGRYRLGSADAPFHVSSRDYVTRLNGEYEINSERCASGPMLVETLRDLVYVPGSDRFEGGALRLRSPAGTATASFNSDGSVTVTGADGTRRMHLASNNFQAWESGCFGGTD